MRLPLYPSPGREGGIIRFGKYKRALVTALFTHSPVHERAKRTAVFFSNYVRTRAGRCCRYRSCKRRGPNTGGIYRPDLRGTVRNYRWRNFRPTTSRRVQIVTPFRANRLARTVSETRLRPVRQGFHIQTKGIRLPLLVIVKWNTRPLILI